MGKRMRVRARIHAHTKPSHTRTRMHNHLARVTDMQIFNSSFYDVLLKPKTSINQLNQLKSNRSNKVTTISKDQIPSLILIPERQDRGKGHAETVHRSKNRPQTNGKHVC